MRIRVVPRGGVVRRSVVAACCVLLSASFVAAQTEPGSGDQTQGQEQQLPDEEVTAKRVEEKKKPTPPNFEERVEQSLQELRSVPGGTSLIKEEDYRTRRVQDISDILKQAPAVFIQSRFGGSETRLSVRGSGVRQTFNAIGVRLLRNGIPISEADGNVRPQLIDPLTVQLAEVYPGANGLIYGSSLLGGAINLITPTGYTAERFRFRLETGSDDYRRLQVSSGQAFDNGLDYYFSVSNLDADGFRMRSDERSFTGYGNIGLQLSDVWETRVHVTGIRSRLELPGSLTKTQIRMDPTQNNNFWASRGAERDFDVLRIDWQLTARFDEDSRLDISASYQNLEMRHPLPFGGPQGAVNFQDREDLNASIRYQGKTDWFGVDNEVVVGLYVLTGDDDSKRRPNPNMGAYNRILVRRSDTVEVFAEDRIEVAEGFKFVAGVHAGWATRDQRVRLGNAVDDKGRFFAVNPKVGVIVETGENSELFASVSRSFEPPTDGATLNNAARVRDQWAWTVEAGVRGGSDRTAWQFAAYYSRVRDEILTVSEPPGSGNTVTGNADKTIHYGFEAAVDHFLELGLVHYADKDGKTDKKDGVRLRATYALTVLRFSDDALWNSNAIPGIPPHRGIVSLVYEHPCGFYIGPNLEFASTYNVDFANTLRAGSYMVYGASAGYNSPDGWRVFVEAQNLADRNYVSNTGLITNANGNDSAVFNPGRPFSMFSGIEVTF